MTEIQRPIKIYATSWCGDSRRARQFFNANHIEYEWIDIDNDPEAEQFVKSVNNGYRSVPTIVFPDGSILVEPSTIELQKKMNIS